MKNTGGPAFPCPEDTFYLGMTLRDWLAGRAITGNLDADTKQAAMWAYEIADAMMAERERHD